MYGAAEQVAPRFELKVTDVLELTAVMVPAYAFVGEVADPVPWLMMMTLPTSPAGAAALTKFAPASVNVLVPEVPVPPVPIFPSPCAPYACTGNCHAGYAR